MQNTHVSNENVHIEKSPLFSHGLTDFSYKEYFATSGSKLFSLSEATILKTVATFHPCTVSNIYHQVPGNFTRIYSKTYVKWPLKIGFQDQLSLNAGQKYCRIGAFCNTFDLH